MGKADVSDARAFKVTIEVYTNKTADASIVHEALCKMLHEDDNTLMHLHEIEFTDVEAGSIKEVSVDPEMKG